VQLRLQMKYAGKLEVSITIKKLAYGFQNTENLYMAHQKHDRVSFMWCSHMYTIEEMWQL